MSRLRDLTHHRPGYLNEGRLQYAPRAPILNLFGFARTMAINAPVISGSDPGAVPGDSTNTPSFGADGVEIGSTNV